MPFQKSIFLLTIIALSLGITLFLGGGVLLASSDDDQQDDGSPPETQYKELDPFNIGGDFGITGTDNYYQSEVIAAEFDFNAIGFVWNQPEKNEYQLKIKTGSEPDQLGIWTDLTLMEEGKDDDIQFSTDLYFPEEISRYFQYRVELISGNEIELNQFKVAYINSNPGGDFSVQDAGSPGIISRAGWGCDEGLMDWTPEYPTSHKIKKVIVHHTAGPNNPSNPKATIRGIYQYHAVTLGWGDIGYNFLVDQYGNIYEGRYGGDSVIGGHASGYNGYEDSQGSSLGISVLGTFSSVIPTSVARSAVEEVTAWKAALHGFNPKSQSLWRGKTTYDMAGHRNYNSTSCPGTAFYNKLPTMRVNAYNKIENYIRHYDVTMKTFGTDLYQAMRGFSYYDIYTRFYNGSDWSNWDDSGGKTLGDVTMEIFNNKLYQAVRGNSSNGIYTRYSSDGTTWSNWVNSGGTSANITMTVFDNKLYQAVRGKSNSTIHTRYSSDGTTWSSWVPNGGTADEVTMTVFSGKLYQAVRGNSSNGIYTRYSSDGTTWSNWVNSGGTRSNVTMEIFDGRLYQAVLGYSTTNTYTRSTANGTSWTEWEFD